MDPTTEPVRPTAFALIAPFLLAAVICTWRGSEHWWRAPIAVLLAPAGLLGYLLYVIAQTGSRDGW